MNNNNIENCISFLINEIKTLSTTLFRDNLNNISDKTLKISILAEYMELLENYNWKAWSKRKITKIDEINRKVEMIDIFILSFIYYIKNKPFVNLNELAGYMTIFNYIDKNQVLNEKKELESIENAIFQISNISHPDFMLKNIIDLIPFKIEDIKEFFYLVESKIVLSIFRDENGYREKKYKKNWGGLEDNHYIHIHILPNLIKKDIPLFKFKNIIKQEIQKHYERINNYELVS